MKRQDFKKDMNTLVKEMMQQSGLNQQQQMQLSQCLNTKQNSNPRLGYGAPPSMYMRDGDPFMFGLPSSHFSRKKKLNTMLRENPNLFEPEQYQSGPPSKDREKEKDLLATYMEYNGQRNVPRTLLDAKHGRKSVKKNTKQQHSQPTQPPLDPKQQRFNQCLAEIEERMEWLEGLRRVAPSEAKQHEALIRGQCAILLKEMEGIDKSKSVVTKNKYGKENFE